MNRKKILIIDDEPGFTEMIKLNLEATGKYEIIVENDPRSALTTTLYYRPQLILLDIIMPHAEGPDIVCQFREHQALADVPVVFLTATVRKDEVVASNGKIGEYEFLAKPVTMKELMDCLERHLP